MGAWKNFDEPEYDRAWDGFYRRFRFNPSIRTSDWPGIVEPADSVTFNIGHVYDGDAFFYDHITHDLGVKLINAFRKCVLPGETLYVLDWQHPCYSFDPHAEFEFNTESDWPIPPLPNGDYYIFLARDMNLGVFGHPWEQTMCVFGRTLVDAFAADPPELFTKTVRVGGHAV
jgi:hypothetical protein